MAQRTTTGFLRQAGLIVAAAFLLAACQAADGTSQAPDTALMNSIMSGMGAVDPRAKQIEYKPRAPLAMPANATNLPQPETAVAGTASPEWPQGQQNESLERVRAVYAENDPMQRERLGKKLTPAQMRGINVRSNRERDIAAENRDEEIISGGLLTTTEQKAINANAIDSAESLRRGEPDTTRSKLATRRFLTEPPSSYSTPAAGAALPEAVKEEKKPTNYDPYSSAPLDMRCLEGGGSGNDRDCRRN
ncbi:hypothetical protein [Roseibium limicola]|uniref:Lipoprotein n=1 Tax=Roseibium limicola TaxID=2816037 RepID=A0A939ENU2_9HYPH|nr:hypothetical protein [Roseibium limicola]MBO0345852.1 hypothetical protein [Roseibium limicola]